MPELPVPPDLPDGYEGVVKMQRPPGERGIFLSWLVYAEGMKHLRRYRRHEFPGWVQAQMIHHRTRFFVARVEHGEWIILRRAPSNAWDT